MNKSSKKAAMFLAGHVLISCLLVFLFCWFFKKSYSILPMHLLVVAATAVASSALVKLALQVQKPSFSPVVLKYFFRLAFAFYFVYLIVFIYAGNFVSHLSFGDMVDKNIVSFVTLFPYSVMSSIFTEGSLANFDYRVGVVLGIWLTVFSVLFLSAYAFSNRVFLYIADSQWNLAGKFLGFCAVLFILAMVFVVNPRNYSWIENEPIVSSLIDDWGPFYDVARIERAEPLERDFLSGEPQQGNKKNLVIIVLDALRADMVSAYNPEKRYLTPFIESLWVKDELVRIDDAFSVCATSWCGIAGILASSYAPELAVNSVSLQRALAKNGYENHFLLSGVHFWLGLNRFYQYGNSLTSFFEGAASDNYQVGDDAMILEKLSGLNEFSGKPAFFYIHLMSPHVFGIKKREFIGFSPVRYPNALSEGYEDGVRQGDYYVQEVFNLLKEKKYLDDAVVFITSDHGESLGERQIWGHGGSVFHQDINVPWLIWGSDEAAIKHRRWVSHVDMAPTAFALLGMTPPKAWIGKPITSEIAPRVLQSQSLGTQGSGVYACLIDVQSGGEVFKYIRYYPPWAPNYDEYVFDLANDPSEQVNLVERVKAEALGNYRKTWDALFFGRL